jgi:hypothetical protein
VVRAEYLATFVPGHGQSHFTHVSAIHGAYAVEVSLYALIAVAFVENGSPADVVQFLPKPLNSFRSTTAIFQFKRCQSRRLSENLDLEINELTDFSLDSSGWGRRHDASSNKFSPSEAGVASLGLSSWENHSRGPLAWSSLLLSIGRPDDRYLRPVQSPRLKFYVCFDL